jgi:hypothetical protein
LPAGAGWRALLSGSLGLALLAATPAGAQETRPATVAIDTTAMVSGSVDDNGNRTTGLVLDAFVSADLGRGFEVMARPFVQHLASGEWNRQIWMAALRFEHHGAVDLRIEAGLIPPPVGLANLTLRPHLNSTLFQPSTLFEALPPLEPGSPRLSLMGAIYPYGASATVSRRWWDARAALIDSSPLRPRRVFAERNPPRFSTLVVGGGITPVVGVRIGASIVRGAWLRAGEMAGVTADQDASVVTVEAELSYRYSKVTAEWVRDSLQFTGGTRRASGWFVQGQQTLTPRWFAAGRVERIAAAHLAASPAAALEPNFTTTEETLGYRLTPELTIRAGHRGRKRFGVATFQHEVAVSLVWWRRWL